MPSDNSTNKELPIFPDSDAGNGNTGISEAMPNRNPVYAINKEKCNSWGPIEMHLEHASKNYEKLQIISVNSTYHDAPLAIEPFLPPVEVDVMTLLLDLDNTMIFCCDREHVIDRPDFLFMEKDKIMGELCYVKIRRDLEWFLSTASKQFEIVVFTAGFEDYANAVLDIIDPNKHIKHRLYRQHCTVTDRKIIKDLSKIGRPLDSIVIVDDMKLSFQLQPYNGIAVPPIRGDCHDNVLRVVMEMLEKISAKKSVKAILGEGCQDYVQLKLAKIEYFYPVEHSEEAKATSDSANNNGNVEEVTEQQVDAPIVVTPSRKRSNSTKDDEHETPTKIAHLAEPSQSTSPIDETSIPKSE